MANPEDLNVLFNATKLLASLYAINVYLGAIFTGIFIILWIAWAIIKHKLKWQEALNMAAESLKDVAKESRDHQNNTESGDEWNPKP